LRPENTIAGFGFAIRLGVSALELDVTLSADRVPIVSHEPIADPALYRDTRPVVAGDRLYPYVGRPWHELDLGRIRTLDAGAPTRVDASAIGRLDGHPPKVAHPAHGRPVEWPTLPDTGVPTLAEVLGFVERFAPPHLRLEVEIKHHIGHGRLGPGAALLAACVVATIRRHGMAPRCRVRAFDWRVLTAVRRLMPELRLVALATSRTASRGSGWTAGVRLGRAPWARSLAGAAADLGATEIAPEHWLVDAALITAAERSGLRVVPWTVNDASRGRELIELGVDGLTTDRPDLFVRAARAA
jgi:glycerophosphoryl diester phosphodiesterase